MNDTIDKLTETPVVICNCPEPGGVVRREVYQIPLSMNNLKEFWAKSSQYKTLFAEDVGSDFEKFGSLLMTGEGDNIRANGLFWVVDDFVGIFYLSNIKLESDALAHYSFFDGRHKGRGQLVRKMLAHVFKKYNFRRLTVELPLYVKDMTFLFVEKELALTKEGRKRKAVFHEDQWWDVNIYGILREEVNENGD